jgi:hypothetical protein
MVNPFFRRYFFLILCTFTHTCLWSQSIPEISADFSNAPVLEVLNFLESNYPVKIFYKEEWFSSDRVEIHLKKRTFSDALDILLKGKPYTFRIINGNQAVIMPRDEVALLIGQIPDYSQNGSAEDRFTQVGNIEETGKNRTAVITGKVLDGKTGEHIIGAIIQLEHLQQGVVTNANGNYKLSLRPGLYTLLVSSVGYEKAKFNIKVLSSGDFSMELFDKSVTLDDVVIYGERVDKNVSSHQMSLVELDVLQIKQLPSISGGKDVIKGLTIMPGVKSIGEFSSGINVRGGGEDQNLYLVNGSPIFNTSHVFGLFSVINPDAVGKLSLYKGHIPADYGERVSSVIEISTLETAPEKTRVSGGIGLYDSRLMVEVPVFKDHLFIDLGGRTSYSNWLLKSMKDYNLSQSRALFYDMNGTIHANAGKSRIALSLYSSYDEFRFTSDVRYKYGNKLGSLHWNYMFNSNLASYLSIAYSSYAVKKDDIHSLMMQSRIRSSVVYKNLKYRIQYSGIKNNDMNAGFSIVQYGIKPGTKEPLNDLSLVSIEGIEKERGIESALFLNDEIRAGKSLVINVGLRYSAYFNRGPGSVATYMTGVALDSSNITGMTYYGAKKNIKIYHGFEPRLSARIRLNEVSSLKLSYNRNLQYISMISYTSVTTPADIWKLADPFIKPIIASQYAIGYYRNFFNNTIETSVEVYYKGLENVIDYKDGAQLEMNPYIETQLVRGTGKNYGIELLVKKNAGRFDGWVTYTYSRSLRKTNGLYKEEMINNNHYYPSSYDRPNDFTIVTNFHLNKRVIFSANFNYSTGRPVTLPEYKFYSGSDVVVYFSEKNKYRIPDYHRLDLSITVNESLRLSKRWKGSWSFSILNVYGRKNPYTVYYKMEEPSPVTNNERFNLYKLYLIGRPVPTISYSFKF